VPSLRVSVLLALSGIALSGASLADESFRCGSKLIVPGMSQAEVLQAGEAVLAELDLDVHGRKRPQIASMQVITNVSPYQSQLLNRFTRGMMLVAGQTMLVIECTPAAYINLAANEAEKAANIHLLEVITFGAFGRLWLGGTEAEIQAAVEAAEGGLAKVSGRDARG